MIGCLCQHTEGKHVNVTNLLDLRWRQLFTSEISPSSENWNWSAVQIPARLTCYVWTVCGYRGTTPWLRQPGRRCNNPAGFSDVLELPIGQTQRTWCFWWQQSAPEPKERLFNKKTSVKEVRIYLLNAFKLTLESNGKCYVEPKILNQQKIYIKVTLITLKSCLKSLKLS